MKEKMSLEEATMKALLGQLDTPEEEKDDVEGIIDGVLVVTDPEITPDEYEEVIDNAKEILEDTPEGEVPFNDQYVGEYLLTCPICGSSFINKDVLNVGDSCPICTEVPEQGFILNGQVATQEDVELQNDIKDNEEETFEEPTEEFEEEPVSEEDVEEVQDELLASEVTRESDKKLEESEKHIEDKYEFKPGYYEWHLLKNGKVIAVFNDFVDELPEKCTKENLENFIDSYLLTHIFGDEEDFKNKEDFENAQEFNKAIEGPDREKILKVMLDRLYYEYGDLEDKKLEESKRFIEDIERNIIKTFKNDTGDMKVEIVKAPNGRYFNYYYGDDMEHSSCNAGPFKTLEDAEKMVHKHRPTVKVQENIKDNYTKRPEQLNEEKEQKTEGQLWGDDSNADKKIYEKMQKFITDLINTLTSSGWNYDNSASKYGTYLFSKNNINIKYCDNYDKIGLASIKTDNKEILKRLAYELDDEDYREYKDYVMLDFVWNNPSTFGVYIIVDRAADKKTENKQRQLKNKKMESTNKYIPAEEKLEALYDDYKRQGMEKSYWTDLLNIIDDFDALDRWFDASYPEDEDDFVALEESLILNDYDDIITSIDNADSIEEIQDILYEKTDDALEDELQFMLDTCIDNGDDLYSIKSTLIEIVENNKNIDE